ncbi:MAG: hypothetical protein H7330_01340 [Hymenobacteraceae bacterium]|nr:hypothetical protein [Hymenobacteraceae bacterium]
MPFLLVLRRPAGALLSLATLLAVAACSAERKGPVARAYHNLAARDNAYFIAREKLKDVEATLLKGMASDYNKVLPVLIPITEQTATSVSADLEDIVKKSSLPIARHKNSNWTDDAYLLVGKARYYKAEFDEAEKVFKFVNTTGKEPNVRHAALVWLMRTFIQEKQLDNAVAVSDLLKKERGLPENARDLFLTRAQLALIRQEPDTAILNLRLAIPEVPTKNERSRLRFILAQLYQQQGKDQLAYAQYRRILRRNPPYELDLFTKLNLAQVTQLSDASGKAKIDKYLARLLKDFKNLEYRDKIYYEMARLEYRQQHYTKAMELLGKSVRATTASSATQKPYSYLLAAQIAYDKLRNYRLASHYYDSTVQVLPATAPEYAAALDRKEVLVDFTKQLDIVEQQDSLQEFARLDTAERNRRLTAMITIELDRRDAAAKQATALAEAAERAGPAPTNAAADAFSTSGQPPGATGGGPFGATNATGLDVGAAASGAVWYFDNPGALGTARADFIRRWGNRTLQDNWRYASMSQRNPAGGGDKTGGLADGANGDSAAATAAAAPDPAQIRAAAAEVLRATLVKDLPKTPEDFKKSDVQIEEALFQLARIYDERLHEPEFAADRYQELLNRFAATEHAPEALYALYLLAQRAKDVEGQRQWATALRTKHPKTEYAQLVDDPDYRQKAVALNAKVHILYDSAFVLYRAGLYPKARAVVVSARREFPVNDIADKLALLDAVLVGYTAAPLVYKGALEQFIVNFPAGPLRPRADELLAALNAQLAPPPPAIAPTATASADSAAAPAPEPAADVVYSTNKSTAHAVLVAYPKESPAFVDLKTQLANYHRANFSSDKLAVTSLLLGEDTELVLVKSFEDARAAKQYEARLRGQSSPLATVDGAYQLIVISLENLPRFYQARDLAGYQAFYEQAYLEE